MFRRLSVAIVGSLVSCCANASIVELLSGPIPQGGGNFLYNYQDTLGSVERLDPAATAGNNPAGTFFTIYDVAGLDVGATLAAAKPVGWTASIQLIGLTPSLANLSGLDNSGIPNVTFRYTGPVIIGPVTITGFQIFSTVSGVTLNAFSSQSTNSSLTASNGTTLAQVGFVPVPGPAPVPLPAAAWLLLSGLGGLGFMRKRKRKS